MSEQKSIFNYIGYASTVIGLIAASLGLWWKLDSEIKSSVMSSTEIVVKQSETNTVDIISIIRSQLKTDILVTKSEIKAYEEQHKHVPDRLTLKLESDEDQLGEIEKKWFKD